MEKKAISHSVGTSADVYTAALAHALKELGIWGEVMAIRPKTMLLHTTQFSPVHKLHHTIDIVGKPHPNSGGHCNRRDILCHW